MDIDSTGYIFQGLLVLTGIIGNLFVAHKNVKGFYIWMITNVMMVFSSYQLNLFGQAFLYIFYTFMLFYSIYKWNDLEKVKPARVKYRRYFYRKNFNK